MARAATAAARLRSGSVAGVIVVLFGAAARGPAVRPRDRRRTANPTLAGANGRDVRSSIVMAPRTVAQNMNLVFYIGLGAGLAVAAGLRPFLPALLAGALASADTLGVDFAHSGFAFLQSGGWLLAVTIAFVASYAVQIAVGPERFATGPLGAAIGGLSIGVGALLFGATLAEHGYASWPGLVAGGACALLAEAAVRPVFGRARTRLPDEASASRADAVRRRGLAARGRARGPAAIRSATSPSRSSAWLLSAIAVARARSTRACGSCAGSGR